MKTFKQYLAFFLIATMALSIVACGKKDKKNEQVHQDRFFSPNQVAGLNPNDQNAVNMLTNYYRCPTGQNQRLQYHYTFAGDNRYVLSSPRGSTFQSSQFAVSVEGDLLVYKIYNDGNQNQHEITVLFCVDNFMIIPGRQISELYVEEFYNNIPAQCSLQQVALGASFTVGGNVAGFPQGQFFSRFFMPLVDHPQGAPGGICGGGVGGVNPINNPGYPYPGQAPYPYPY